MTGRIVLDFEGDLRSIDEYERAGGYAQLKRAVGLPPEEIIATVDRSGLRGRGGAGFP
ncbi:MAG: NADH-quinone oxidoreductase subunit, partial [Gaiellales bacterium]|nr:NADH-quinone oxidoreductase subunit [Gaiellales bacterium]